MKSLKVLLIDDEPAILEGFEIYLLSLGHEVITATSGPEGIEQCPSDCDLVITDRRMPRMLGEEVIKHLKSKHPGIKAILATSENLGEGVRQVIKAAGADDIWIKPVGLVEMKLSLEKLSSG